MASAEKDTSHFLCHGTKFKRQTNKQALIGGASSMFLLESCCPLPRALRPQGRGRRRSLLTRQVCQLQDGGVGDPVIKLRVGVPTPAPPPDRRPEDDWLRPQVLGRLLRTHKRLLRIIYNFSDLKELCLVTQMHDYISGNFIIIMTTGAPASLKPQLFDSASLAP